MSLGIRYKSYCDGCGRCVYVPRACTRVNASGEVVPLGDVHCKSCTTLAAAGKPLRYDTPEVPA